MKYFVEISNFQEDFLKNKPERSLDFSIFSIETLGKYQNGDIPAYKTNFYQIAILQNSGRTEVSLNTTPFGKIENSLFFAAPGQTVSWNFDPKQKGIMVHFKEEFISYYPQKILDEFPFFSIRETNLLALDQTREQEVASTCNSMSQLFLSEEPHKVPMLKAYLLVLLFQTKTIYEAGSKDNVQKSRALKTVHEFQQLINKNYVKKKNVEEYAQLLNLSPNYLNELVKQSTGRNAKHFINERILIESKNLLSYTQKDVAEIAYEMGFSDASHFGKFIKKQLQITPLEFRKQQTNVF